jgi:hypothetical protein
VQGTVKLTTHLFRLATLVTATLDIGLVLLLVWRVEPARFRRLKWPLAVVAFIFWGSVWTYAMWGDWWGLAYRYIFPEWMRWVGPLVYAVLSSGVCLGGWWLAQRIPWNAVVNYCVLGGLVSLAGHSWAIYGRGMFEKVPILQGVSPASALTFGVFEFIVYWSVILAITVLIRCVMERGGNSPQPA